MLQLIKHLISIKSLIKKKIVNKSYNFWGFSFSPTDFLKTFLLPPEFERDFFYNKIVLKKILGEKSQLLGVLSQIISVVCYRKCEIVSEENENWTSQGRNVNHLSKNLKLNSASNALYNVSICSRHQSPW